MLLDAGSPRLSPPMDKLSVERFDEAVQSVFAVFGMQPGGGDASACGSAFAVELNLRVCLEELLCQSELGFRERQASERVRQRDQARQAWQHRLAFLQRELAKERCEKENALYSLQKCSEQLAELEGAHAATQRTLAATARALAEHERRRGEGEGPGAGGQAQPPAAARQAHEEEEEEERAAAWEDCASASERCSVGRAAAADGADPGERSRGTSGAVSANSFASGMDSVAPVATITLTESSIEYNHACSAPHEPVTGADTPPGRAEASPSAACVLPDATPSPQQHRPAPLDCAEDLALLGDPGTSPGARSGGAESQRWDPDSGDCPAGAGAEEAKSSPPPRRDLAGALARLAAPFAPLAVAFRAQLGGADAAQATP